MAYIFWFRRLINVLQVNLQLEAGFFGSKEKRACEAQSLSVLIINFPVSQVSIYRVFCFCHYFYHHFCYLDFTSLLEGSLSQQVLRLIDAESSQGDSQSIVVGRVKFLQLCLSSRTVGRTPEFHHRED
jgi:hypothetical protein